MAIQLSPEEFTALKDAVKAEIAAESTGVNEFPIATTLNGVISLPAYRDSGSGKEVVTVLTSLLKGDPVTLRMTATALQWKYVSEPDTAWRDLITVATIQKPAVDAAAAAGQTMLQISTDWSTNVKPAAEAATADADDTAKHPTYVGEDYYVYEWNKAAKTYNKTDIYLKGDSFKIEKVYPSIAAMNADVNNPDILEGDFVMVNTGSVEDPDTAKLYVKTKTGSTYSYQFIVDMSGAIGFTGKTPQLGVGTVGKTTPGGTPTVTLTDDGVDGSGNPKYKLNFVFPTGDTGPAPIIQNGTITTGEPGSAVNLTFTYVSTNAQGVPIYRADGSIPQGQPGTGSGNVFVTTTGLLASKTYLFKPGVDGSPNGTMVEYTGTADKLNYVTSAGTATAYTAVLPGFVLATGSIISVKMNIANTAVAPTLNVNATGAKVIVGQTGGALVAGELVVNGVYLYQYNGTQWVLMDSRNAVMSGKLGNSVQITDFAAFDPTLLGLSFGEIRPIDAAWVSNWEEKLFPFSASNSGYILKTSATERYYVIVCYAAPTVVGTSPTAFRKMAGAGWGAWEYSSIGDSTGKAIDSLNLGGIAASGYARRWNLSPNADVKVTYWLLGKASLAANFEISVQASGRLITRRSGFPHAAIYDIVAHSSYGNTTANVTSQRKGGAAVDVVTLIYNDIKYLALRMGAASSDAAIYFDGTYIKNGTVADTTPDFQRLVDGTDVVTDVVVISTNDIDATTSNTKKLEGKTLAEVAPTPLVKTVAIPVSAWVASADLTKGAFSAKIEDVAITDGADIEFSPADVASTDIVVAANLYTTFTGGVGFFEIYCKTVPTGSINLQYRVSWL